MGWGVCSQQCTPRRYHSKNTFAIRPKRAEKVELEGLTKELGGNIELAIRRLAEKKRNQNNEIP